MGRAFQDEVALDDDLFVILNAHDEEIEFQLPRPGVARWRRLIDTSGAVHSSQAQLELTGSAYLVKRRSLVLLHARKGSGEA